MAGLLSGLSDFLYGQAPGSDLLSQMQQNDSLIQSLYKNAPQSNILGSPAFSQIQSMLAPGANGSLSSYLQPQYNYGMQQNALNTNSGIANAEGNAASRNLSGSSIEQMGINGAQIGGQLANSSLLASLYGTQNQNNSYLAQLLNSGGQFDINQNNNLLNSYAAALAGISNQEGQIGQSGQAANYESNAGLVNSLGGLGAGLGLSGLSGLFGGAGGGGTLAGGGAGSALGLSGSGWGMPGFGSSSYSGLPALTGGAGYATPSMF